MKFTVDRSKWHRGKGGNGSALLRGEDGKRCCVGFYFAAHGYDDEELIGRPYTPSHRPYDETFTGLQAMHRWLGKNATDGGDRVYAINDDPTISDAEREAKLMEEFAANGHEVTFLDSVRP
jgi:hypothetical protein